MNCKTQDPWKNRGNRAKWIIGVLLLSFFPAGRIAAAEPGEGQESGSALKARTGDDQIQPLPVAPPGSDATRFVPGTSVDYFGPAGFVRAGGLLLRPSGRLTYTYHSNLFNEPRSRHRDHQILVEPAIEGFVPISQNGLRFDYAFGYRDFRNFEPGDKTSHTINADSQFDFSPIVSLSIRDHFAISSLNPAEYVPGREIIFSDARFRRNHVEGLLNWNATPNNNIGLRGGWNTVGFEDDPSRGEPFYDYDQYQFAAFVRRDVSRRTALFVDGSFLRNDTLDPRDIADLRGHEVVAGVETLITPITSGQFSAGYRKETYPRARDQDFLGTVFRGSLHKEFSERIRMSLALARSTNPSNFENNAYYVSFGIGLTYFHELARNLIFSFAPGYQRNSYPLPLDPLPPGSPRIRDSHRVDRLADVAAVLRYTASDLVAFDARFDAIRRNSDLPEHRFTNYRISLTLVVGYRGGIRGHMPY
jgi:hypothetical protein